MNRGFIINEPLMNAAKELTDVEFRELFTKAFDYAVFGKEISFESKQAATLFAFFKPFIDSNNQKYNEKVKTTLGRFGIKEG